MEKVGNEDQKKDQSVKVAGIQMACHSETDKNLEKVLNLIKMAAEQDAKIICLQEFFHTPWFPAKADESLFSLSETLSGPIVSSL